MKIKLRNLFLVATLLLVLFMPCPVFAEIQTITATGEYNMGESETLTVAKERAVHNAMQNAVQKAGVYIESYTKVINSELSKDEINMIASGIIEVIDKKFDRKMNDTGGDFIKVIITCRVNTDNISAMQNKLQDKSVVETLKKVQSDKERLLQEVTELKKKLAQAQNSQDKKQIEIQIAKNEQSVTSVQWFDKGYDYQVNKKDYDNAIIAYMKAIELNPQYAEAYYNRGIAYDDKGQYDTAIVDYNKVIVLNPQNANAYNNRGVAYDDKGQYDIAIADYTKAIELNPQYVSAYYNRGNAYRHKGQYDLAIVNYNKAIELNPQHANAYYNKAIVCRKLGRNSEAIEAYKLFLRYASSTDPDIETAKQRIRELGGTI